MVILSFIIKKGAIKMRGIYKYRCKRCEEVIF